MKTYAIYDREDFPIVVGSIFFCAEKLGVSERSIYTMLKETKNESKKNARCLDQRAFIIGNDDEKLEMYLVDRKKIRMYA